MKKIFTLAMLALASLTASATDYTDNLKVTIGGASSAEQQAMLQITQQANGKYKLVLPDFIFQEPSGSSIAFGTINVTDLEPMTKEGVTAFSAATTATVTNGNDPSEMWLGPMLFSASPLNLKLTTEFKDGKAFAKIKLSVQSVGEIDVVFGKKFSDAFYQAQNSNFEEFVGTGAMKEPKYWHSFGSATGGMAFLVRSAQQIEQSTDVRPGTSGTYSVLVKARSIFSTIANGNLTTGRINAGGFDATDSTTNYNFDDPAETAVDQSGAPFLQRIIARPDSLEAWVKFVAGEGSTTDQAALRAVVHDNTRYQMPESTEATNVVSRAEILVNDTRGEWKRIVVPFTEVNAGLMPGHIIFSFSTNAKAGKGTGDDKLYVDDVRLIYKDESLVTTGVGRVSTVVPAAEEGIFTLDGRRVQRMEKGQLYIIKEAGKKPRKAFKY